MRQRPSQLAIGAVMLILGFLVIVQLNSQNSSPALAGSTAQELTVLIANLNTGNDQLRQEVAGLENELRRLADAQSRGATSVDQMRSDLLRVQAWAGLAPVSGPGVTITVHGPIEGPAVQDLLNELWNAGAEAAAVDGVRIAPGTVVAGPAGGISLEATALGDPFRIDAIGSPETLTGSLTRIGGIVAQIAATRPDVVIEVGPVGRLELPATARRLAPIHGRPRL